jgi:antitoxin VapB
MPLSIRDPRAAALARDLAKRRGTTMTQAIICALEAEIERDRQSLPLSDRLLRTAAEFNEGVDPHRRMMTKDEIDEMWGE